MKRSKLIMLLLLWVGLGFTTCEDPEELFNPKNPELSVDAIVGGVNSTGLILDGLESQLVLTFNELVVPAEILSDNYENTRLFYNRLLDDLEIRSSDTDLNSLLFNISRLRELSIVGQTVVAPNDPSITPDAIAELKFFEGLSYLLGAEYFTTFPATAGGRPLTITENLNEAITAFTEGLDLATLEKTIQSLTLARARAYYQLGDAENAVVDAQSLLDLSSTFIRFVQFDAQNGLTNTMQDALYDRSSFDDLQPLPRLDFLDPKFDGDEPLEESNIPFLKAEEAYLILIEAAIARGDILTTQEQMFNLLDLVSFRPTETINELVEGRPQFSPGSRPNNSAVSVAAVMGAPFRTGLVLDRNALTVVPVISGTSVTREQILEISTLDEALYTTYLLRQEIFMAEGRRMTDLGLRFVISDEEATLNPNVQAEDTMPNLPPFMVALADSFDRFTYNRQNNTVVIAVDLNAAIVVNKESQFVAPFE